MNNGGINTFTSRRGHYLDCEYWLVEKGELQEDKSELIHKKKSEGTFDAKIENTEENTSSVIAQTFMFDSTTLSISTNDDVPGLKRNCLVVIEQWGRKVIWRVESTNKKPIRCNYEFGEVAFKTYIELRR